MYYLIAYVVIGILHAALVCALLGEQNKSVKDFWEDDRQDPVGCLVPGLALYPLVFVAYIFIAIYYMFRFFIRLFGLSGTLPAKTTNDENSQNNDSGKPTTF